MVSCNTHQINDSLKVSVALTVLNEAGSIRRVIDSLMAQTRKPDEIVVCDGGSLDTTVEELNHLAAEGIPVRVIVDKGACRGRGRNRAIKAAQYSYVAIIDAGMTVEPQWLEHLIAPCLLTPSIEIVYGSVVPIVEDRFSACIAALTIGRSHVKGKLCPSVASLLIIKELWYSIGGFPEGLTTAEDLIFINRLKGANVKSVLAPDAVVFWTQPNSIKAVYRRFAGYSRGGLAAGFARTWHYGTARNMVIYLVLIMGGLILHPFIALGVPTFHIIRLKRYFGEIPWLKRQSYAQKIADYLLGGTLLTIIDIATIVGTWQWIVKDKCLKKAITFINAKKQWHKETIQ